MVGVGFVPQLEALTLLQLVTYIPNKYVSFVTLKMKYFIMSKQEPSARNEGT